MRSTQPLLLTWWRKSWLKKSFFKSISNSKKSIFKSKKIYLNNKDETDNWKTSFNHSKYYHIRFLGEFHVSLNVKWSKDASFSKQINQICTTNTPGHTLTHSDTRTLATLHTRTLANSLTWNLAHLHTCTLANLHTRTLANSQTCTLAHLHTCKLANLHTRKLAH